MYIGNVNFTFVYCSLLLKVHTYIGMQTFSFVYCTAKGSYTHRQCKFYFCVLYC